MMVIFIKKIKNMYHPQKYILLPTYFQLSRLLTLFHSLNPKTLLLASRYNLQKWRRRQQFRRRTTSASSLWNNSTAEDLTPYLLTALSSPVLATRPSKSSIHLMPLLNQLSKVIPHLSLLFVLVPMLISSFLLAILDKLGFGISPLSSACAPGRYH